MDENRLRFGVGVLVISAIGIGIILTFLFGAFPTVLQREYTLSVRFPSAEGVGLNTPVLRDGVPIGRVSDIELIRPGEGDQDGGVVITLAMKADAPLTHRYIPKIGSGNLVTGDAKLEFVKGTDAELAAEFADNPMIIPTGFTEGEYIDYGKPSNSLLDIQDNLQGTLDAIRLAGDSITSAGTNVNQLAEEVRRLVGGTDQKIDRVANEAVGALEEFQGAMNDIRRIVGNRQMQQGLEATIEQLPEVLSRVKDAVTQGETTLQSIEKAGDQFQRVGVAAEETVKTAKSTVEQAGQSLGNTIRNAEKTFDNVERFTRPFADNSEQFSSQLLTTLASLERTLNEVEAFGKTLNQSNGTVKRLLDDDNLYYEIRRTVENIEEATAKLRPILDDVRVFTDKIARDPRQLGVRGAIAGRPNGAGVK